MSLTARYWLHVSTEHFPTKTRINAYVNITNTDIIPRNQQISFRYFQKQYRKTWTGPPWLPSIFEFFWKPVPLTPNNSNNQFAQIIRLCDSQHSWDDGTLHLNWPRIERDYVWERTPLALSANKLVHICDGWSLFACKNWDAIKRVRNSIQFSSTRTNLFTGSHASLVLSAEIKLGPREWGKPDLLWLRNFLFKYVVLRARTRFYFSFLLYVCALIFNKYVNTPGLCVVDS